MGSGPPRWLIRPLPTLTQHPGPLPAKMVEHLISEGKRQRPRRTDEGTTGVRYFPDKRPRRPLAK